MLKKLILSILILSFSFTTIASTCSENFESQVQRQKDALPGKAVMITLATVFAFPVGFSATSIEGANANNVVQQAQAYRVIKDSYSGAGPNLNHFIEDLQEELEQEVNTENVIAFLEEFDQKDFCRAFNGFPNRQLPYRTYSEMLEKATVALNE